jgi:GAF domain-containing protein
VFNAIAASVQRLFGGHASSVTRVVGDMLHLAAFTATSEAGNEALKSSFPRPLSFPGTHTMAALSRKPAYSIDFENDPNVSPELKAVVRTRGIRSQLSVPMLRDGVAIGTIAVTRTEPGQFSNHQISLMETFADQAVIAIENVRLFQELEARTNALTRSVSQLTALGEVGQAISSTLDLEKVLKTIAAHAVQLTGLDVATIYEFDEATGQFELRAWQNMPEDLISVYRQMPLRLGEGVVGKAAALREPVQVPDIHDPAMRRGIAIS